VCVCVCVYVCVQANSDAGEAKVAIHSLGGRDAGAGGGREGGGGGDGGAGLRRGVQDVMVTFNSLNPRSVSYCSALELSHAAARFSLFLSLSLSLSLLRSRTLSLNLLLSFSPPPSQALLHPRSFLSPFLSPFLRLQRLQETINFLRSSFA